MIIVYVLDKLVGFSYTNSSNTKEYIYQRNAQKTGSLFHQFASNVQAGKMSLAVGRYSEIHLNRSKGLGIKGFRPDVTGVTKNGLRVVEVVSSSQTYASQVAKIGRMMGQYSHISNGLTIDVLRFITSWFVF